MKYIWDHEYNLFRCEEIDDFSYSDGAEVEQRIFRIIQQVSDRSTFSTELLEHITDWPSEYHLSRARHCLIRPLGIKPGDKVLELGCGCGAITRYLGEIGAEVTAVEGSIMRARIAAERCRDLNNVKVFVDDLLRYESEKKFDWILLIGVLEYAPVFVKADEPAQHYLHCVSRLLSCNGKLVIAIENKLGLKYFNNCAEDHLGVPFYGLQDLYNDSTPRTYGRIELIQQLTSAGFSNYYFHYPFPDYKLPAVIFSEDALKNERFEVIDLLAKVNSRDYSGSSYRLFDESLVFNSLYENGLIEDFSNSFLVVASQNDILLHNSDKIAMTFATNRIPEFTVSTSFLHSENAINVLKEPLQTGLRRNRKSQDGYNLQNVLSMTAYQPGYQILWRLLAVRAAGGSIEDIVTELYPWISYLMQCAKDIKYGEFAAIQNDTKKEKYNLAEFVVPGNYIDCTPFNLLKTREGAIIFIDDEWQAECEVPLGWIVTRGVLHSLGVGLASRDSIKSITEVVRALGNVFYLSVTDEEVISWINMEKRFLSLVTGQEHLKFSISEKNTTSGLVSLNYALIERDKELAVVKQEVEERNSQISRLEQKVMEQSNQIVTLMQTVTEQDNHLTTLSQKEANCSSQVVILNELLVERDNQVLLLEKSINESDKLISEIYASKSWILTKPLRNALRIFNGKFIKESNCDIFKKMVKIKRLLRTSKELLARGAFEEVWRRIKIKLHFSKESGQIQIPRINKKLEDGIVILATKHTLFVAMLIKKSFSEFGFNDIVILDNEPDHYEDKIHIVICPQMFSKMPLQYITFQMEQSVSSRWFTKDYFNRLENSMAIMDYSLANIKFLQQNELSYRQIFYTPISSINDLSELMLTRGHESKSPTGEAEYDVVFYGDVNCPRRIKFLEEIKKNFKLLIISEVFGEDLYRQLKKARIVLNIHYYQNALLETTRIYECLSLGLDVISEESSDIEEHTNLREFVTFTPIDDTKAMIDAIRQALVSKKKKVSKLPVDINHFSFYFGRMLVAMDLMPIEKILDLLPLGNLNHTIALSLPETYLRREHFSRLYPQIPIFHGLRHYHGWIGCALSYKFLCHQAKRSNLKYLSVCEDDVQMSNNFIEKWDVVQRFLFNELGTDNWDIFCGVIADVSDDVNVVDVVDYEGIRFVTIDKMTSMVFNIYGKNAIEAISNWDSDNRDVQSNTIDRYLENRVKLKVVTTIPFIVGHEPDLNSTLWNFKNNVYDDMISKSQTKLMKKTEAFLELKNLHND
ncbi:methyltransferase [Heliophilum fasciatum]|uniref:Methyltransferase family protein n=1 Tax=Heliophilum fasciatum TaxID=35700 RepID=A0A4R2RY66_9FIRM|nr:methyltransferase [Heliophilum fasciatum]MCW2278994.1 SAM-dependent methyltransferase/uncharacterized coiled-coil protein SlyX [Heliophilum fasciatum]TCP64055.1 methyltransferase family protein [Heliophilum fasciatum]